ncbi:hypothetical protein ACQ4PT_010836 [Festuca glaucescens]
MEEKSPFKKKKKKKNMGTTNPLAEAASLLTNDLIVEILSCLTTRKDILEIHAAQKELMVRYFANLKYRVAITSDMWTADHQKKGYMVVTAHYIDESRNLKSFLSRFAYVPCPHNGEVICQALYECLVDWHLEGKISTITLDNCTSNDKDVEELTDKLNTTSLMLNGDCNSTLYAEFQSVLADEEEPMEEDVSILTKE